jgi:hypothetical protein
MPSVINSDNGVVSGTAGLKSSADNSGVLDLQTNGTTAISISASQVVTFANQPAYTGGTANGVLYLNGSKVLTSGSALTFDGTNLGIGTASPSGRLHVANTGTAGTTADNLAVYFTSTNRNSNVYIRAKNTEGSVLNFADGDSDVVGRIAYEHSDNTMRFDASGSEAMRLTSTGLGIGTTSPAAKLQISSGSGGDTTGLRITRTDAGGGDWKIWSTATVNGEGGGKLIFGTSANYMTLDGSGNVGIGLTSPAFKFDVAGTGNFQGIQTSGSPSLTFGANKWMIQYESNTTRTYYCGPDASTRNNWEVYSATSTGAPLLTARFNSDRNLAINNLGLSTTPTTSGTGITFPATQATSSNANTLDDYEEGTWTPALAFGGGSTGITYLERSGSYVKIGRVVYAWMSIYLTNKGSSTGSAQINGLPFTGTNGFYNEQAASLSDVSYITFGGILMARVGGSTLTGGINCLQLYQVTSGNAFTDVSNTGFANNTSISIFVSYTTNS